MKKLSDRTKGFTDSVIRRMTRISNKYGAVNLSQGFPDFDPPREILDRLAEIAHEGPHQYSITWGSQAMREALAAKQATASQKLPPFFVAIGDKNHGQQQKVGIYKRIRQAGDHRKRTVYHVSGKLHARL